MAWGEIETLDRGDGVKLAYERLPGNSPMLVWLGGFQSDMGGTKAQHLAEWAHQRRQAFLRFDYSGHGRSGGAFEDQDIATWLGDCLAMIDRQTEGPLVLVGSSMGGWLALLAARERQDRVQALLLIAPAWDFTERLMAPLLSEAAHRALAQTGRFESPSPYGGSTVITRRLLEVGRAHGIGESVGFAGPVRILQGGRDPDVPEAHARALLARLTSSDVRFDRIPDGDHRLSRPDDLEKLTALADELTNA